VENFGNKITLMTMLMTNQPLFRKLSLFCALAALILLLANNEKAIATTQPDTNETVTVLNNQVAPKWKTAIPSRDCGGHNNCHASSAVVADLTGNGRLEIIVASNNGYVLAYTHNNNGLQLLWQRDLAPHFGMPAGKQRIHSSPAVADLNGDGSLEIVIGAGSTVGSDRTRGGIIVLNADGSVRANWPQIAADEISPQGYPDAIYATPALGDLTGDGQLEIVATGFDKRIYAWRHDGTLLPGFPIDSYHLQRFPTWTDLVGKLADTIWSSPALADLTGDGYLEIVVGTDEGNYDNSWGGNGSGWTCPYATPPGWPPGYCGGAIYAIDRFGNILPGFPLYKLQIIQSTPLLYDATQNGRPEIFVGTGTFYDTNAGHRFYALDADGNDLPGWAGGKPVGGNVPGSPAIGDITGDGQLEIVVAAMDKKLYAWRLDGSTVPGFPMIPRDQTGNSYTYNVGSTPILADYTGNGKMEIFLTTAWSITIINGQGQQLTTTSNPPNAPFYYAEGTLQNTPVVADLDGNGRLELITFNSHLYVWDLDVAGAQADWPMFKGNPERNGHLGQPILNITPGNIALLHKWGDPGNIQTVLNIHNIGTGSFTWNVVDLPDRVALAGHQGNVDDKDDVLVTINTSGLAIGTYHLGHIIIEATNEGQAIPNSPLSIPVSLYVVEEIHAVYLPLIVR
jgi:hypothetical protein